MISYARLGAPEPGVLASITELYWTVYLAMGAIAHIGAAGLSPFQFHPRQETRLTANFGYGYGFQKGALMQAMPKRLWPGASVFRRTSSAPRHGNAGERLQRLFQADRSVEGTA